MKEIRIMQNKRSGHSGGVGGFYAWAIMVEIIFKYLMTLTYYLFGNSFEISELHCQKIVKK